MSNSTSSTQHSLRTRDYTVNKLDTIRSAIAGYAGGVAIARELVQNADDAQSDFIEFYFTEDALLVRNGSNFSDENLDAICRLASGSKRDDEETTGTWGTGFLSVYQITDYPELHSAGVHLTFDPNLDKLEEHFSSEVNGTMFRFAWRTAETDISRYIGAECWPTDRISSFYKQLCQELYTLSPFLRNIRRLSVFSGVDRSKPDCQIQWITTDHNTLSDGTSREKRTVHLTAGGQTTEHQWFFYASQVKQRFLGASGHQVKKPDVGFGFGFDGDHRLVKPDGLIYNYLPTNLRTDYDFHIQGDFFPDNNRTTILTDTSKMAEWNRNLIASIAKLFGSSLLTVRDDAPNRQVFYALLASVIKPKLSPLLDNVANQVRAIASDQPIIYTYSNSWEKPATSLLSEAPALAELAKDHVPGITSDEVPSSVSQFLNVPQYTFSMFLSRITEVTKPGTSLEQADPIVRGRDRLNRILEAVVHQHQRRPDGKLLEALKKAPLCLYHSGHLYPLAGYTLYGAVDEVRSLFHPQSLNLIDATFQADHEQLIKSVNLKWAGFTEAYSKMKSWGEEYRGKLVPICPQELKTSDQLKRLLLYFSKNSPNSSFNLLGLPLCPDGKGDMGCVGDPVYVADSECRTWLQKTGVRFISDDLQSDPEYVALLLRFGHTQFNSSVLVNSMVSLFASPCPIKNAHPLFNRPAKWKRLAHYLADHSSDLNQDTIKQLRSIPFIPTQKENFASIMGDHAVLKLPPSRSGEATGAEAFELLEVDNLVSSHYVDRKSQDFLRTKLHVQPLSLLGYISEDIVRHYDKQSLGHNKRFELLKLMRDVPDLRLPQHERASDKVRKLCLIRCTDDQYRRPSEVYIPSELLDTLLPHGYATPHLRYGVSKHGNVSRARMREEERWQNFLEWLGLQRLPMLGDLTDSIVQTVSNPPTERGIEHIRIAYNYLCEHWNDLEPEAGQLAFLKDIAWLPAANDVAHWHLPHSLYPANLRRYIESQAKTLIFRDAPHRMSDFFSMNRDVQVIDVVNHLLWLSENHKAPAAEIYEFLSKHLSNPAIEKLRNRPIVYDRSKAQYWVPQRVLFGDYIQQLGPYFGYVTDQPGLWMQTLKYLGALDRLEPLRDYATLLKDIAEKFENVPIDENNAALLQYAYRQLASSAVTSEQQNVLSRQLSAISCVMDQDMYLQFGSETCFNDRPDLLSLFKAEIIPSARYNSDAARDFLTLIGVRPISEIVQRTLHEVKGEEVDEQFTEHFRSLGPQFRRIIRSYQVSFPTGWCDVDKLFDVRVLHASEIQVSYFIDANTIQAQGVVKGEEAWFDPELGSLYLRSSEFARNSTSALAKEIAKIINDELRPEILTPVLKNLLATKSIQEATTLLDDLGIARLDLTDEFFERDNQEANLIALDEDQPDTHDPTRSQNFSTDVLATSSNEATQASTINPEVSTANLQAIPIVTTYEPNPAAEIGKGVGTPQFPGRSGSADTTAAQHSPNSTSSPGYASPNSYSRTGASWTPGSSSSGGGSGGHFDPPKPGASTAPNKAETNPDERVQEYRTQREGSKHRYYKEYLSGHLDLVAPNLRLYDPNVKTEYRFPSYDCVDILCADENGLAIPIEVETAIRPQNYVGAWQAEKYRHLTALLNDVKCSATRSILVAPKIPQDVKDWCKKTGIEAYEVPLPPDLAVGSV